MNQALVMQLKRITAEEQKLLDGNALNQALYTSSEHFLVDSARLLRKGSLITLRPHTRFVDFPKHQHNFIEMTYMVSGQTRHTVNSGEKLTLRAGELLMMNQHAVHAIEAAGMDDLAVNILVQPAFFDAVLDMIGADNVLGRFLLDALREQDAGMPYLYFQVADVAPVQQVLESMVHCLAYEIPNSRRINQLSMSLLFLHLLNHTDQLQLGAGRQEGEGIAVAALREIEENYRTAALTEVAQKHGCSLSYLSRMVKKATGRTFNELLTTKRMEKAALLLGQSSLTIAEIMQAVGYQNSSHFYHLFERSFGVSPHTYRKNRTE